MTIPNPMSNEAKLKEAIVNVTLGEKIPPDNYELRLGDRTFYEVIGNVWENEDLLERLGK